MPDYDNAGLDPEEEVINTYQNILEDDGRKLCQQVISGLNANL
jgi:hypothetical protein